MDIVKFAQDVLDFEEVRKELEPIETAVDREMQQLETLRSEVHRLAEEATKAELTVESANRMFAEAKQAVEDGNAHYERQVRRGELVRSSASSKAASILREQYEQRDELEAASAALREERNQLRVEVQQIQNHKAHLELEVDVVSRRVEELRNARAELLNQARADITLE